MMGHFEETEEVYMLATLLDDKIAWLVKKCTLLSSFPWRRRDIGVVDPRHKEPFIKLLPQGYVTGQSFRIKSTGQYILPKEAILEDDQKMVRRPENWRKSETVGHVVHFDLTIVGSFQGRSK